MASRPLTEAESRYSNIEHVCLAITYRLEQFDYYLVGQGVTGETDHTPLEHIFKKSTNEAPSRLQRLILRCLRLDVHVQYNHGISIPVANALSRVCHRKTGHNPEQATEDSASQHNIHFITTPIDLVAVESSTAQDRALRLLKSTILEKAVPARTMGVLELSMRPHIRGWPRTKRQQNCHTSLHENQVLQAIHLGHLGDNKCILRARESVL